MSTQYVIGGIQQIGVGLRNMKRMDEFFASALDFDITMFDEKGSAGLMSRYTGGTAWQRHAKLRINTNGGGGIELWKFINRTPTRAEFAPSLKSRGILANIIRCRDVSETRQKLFNMDIEVSQVCKDPTGNECFFFRDPDGNYHYVVTCNDYWLKSANSMRRRGSFSGGVYGAIIAVSSIDASLALYRDILGYTRVVFDEEKMFDDFAYWDDNCIVRRMRLERPKWEKGTFLHLLGSSIIELVEVRGMSDTLHTYANRYWGDPGFIHLCFDVNGMDALSEACKKAGFPFTVDSGSETSFSMENASGRFAYCSDPDGTLIEFVEAYSIPLVKRPLIRYNLRKRTLGKPLPKLIFYFF